MYPFLIAAVLAAFDSGMSVQEMRQTGMVKLSAQEKLVLEDWIEQHYTKKFIAQNGQKGPILEENLKNGRYIRLSDRSLWEINPADTPVTQGWITPAEIKVTSSDDSTYPYNLTNTLTGSTVKARKSTQTTPAPTPKK